MKLTAKAAFAALAVATALLSAPMASASVDSIAPEPRLQDDSAPLIDEIVRLDVAARVDYQHTLRDGRSDDALSGFEGKYIMMRIDGSILPGLTYSWRQRFSKSMAFFEATDWLYLNYEYRRWGFQAGKQVVAIGGYEYDRNPIDLFACSLFWNNVPCYAFGVSASYGITSRDRLTFQVCQSPFATRGMQNIYAYNLMWNGHHGFYESIFSANLVEYQKGRYINYIALGNKFTFGKFALELDLMNRAASGQTFLFKDCSVMTELGYRPTDRWRIFAKHTYDVNRSGTDADMIVTDGSELNMIGAGVEFFPLMKRRTSLRIHAAAFYSWGHNANSADLMQNKTTFISAGLTWDMNVLNIHRKH